MATRLTWLRQSGNRSGILGERCLALRVIKQALKDASLKHEGLKYAVLRSDACEFLFGSESLRFWCEIAGIDARYATARFRRMFA